MEERLCQLLAVVVERLDLMLVLGRWQMPGYEWFTVKEAALILDKEEDTIRKWCLENRIAAEKQVNGRGGKGEWRIHRKEIERYRREGLFPPRADNGTRLFN